MKNGKQILPLNPALTRPNGNWKRLSELTEVFGVKANTLRKWCEDGTFRDFGYETYRHSSGWRVNIPFKL